MATHCTRCQCSLDVGDTYEHTPDTCVSCVEIRKGTDAWRAMMIALIHKDDALKAEAERKAVQA